MTREMNYGPSQRLLDLGPNLQNLVPVAQDVAIARGQLVAQVLFEIAAIRSLQLTAAHPECAIVTCVAAHVQTSSAQHQQQAAHLLPGQIMIGAEPVWMLAKHPDAALSAEVSRLAHQTRMCFAWTNVLPALFNIADSEAEGTGRVGAAQTLKPLFASIVQTLWKTARVDPAQPLTIDRAATLTALRRWFEQVTRVYLDAASRKAARGRQDEARVLTTYADSFKVANVGRFVLANIAAQYHRYGALRA
jgi:hypothetical protein